MFKRFLLCFLFFSFSPLVLSFALYLSSSLSFSQFGQRNKIISAEDRVLGDSISSTNNFFSFSPQDTAVIASMVRAENSTPIIIENYLKHFNSPLFPYREKILQEAKEHKVKPQLIVAIAQQESNLGKKSPTECFNAWGWAIHEKGTMCFSDWNEAIEVVTAGIDKGYCRRGYCDDPCEMMKKYAPKSNGSWCLGIKQFLNEMETGNF